MTGLILEGGAFRGLYTDGVLDALLDNHIHFDYVIGVSAGISNGYSYVSGQSGRNIEIIRKYVNDKRYFGSSNFLKCKSIFGMDFVFGEIPQSLVPFDSKAFAAFPGTVLAGITNADTGEIEYFKPETDDPSFMLLRATCAIPFFFPVIHYHGGRYFDGGLADPIPIHKALSDGCRKNLVVLTQPKGYQKKPSSWTPKLIKLKYPALAPILTQRHSRYNECVQFCEEEERSKNAVLLRPNAAVNVSRFERNLDKLNALYQAGYQDTLNQMEAILTLFT